MGMQGRMDMLETGFEIFFHFWRIVGYSDSDEF